MTMLHNTPWEIYTIGNRIVHVKREDLCCGQGGPPFSKMRGVVEHIIACGKPIIAVLDTGHSMAGWGVAWACNNLNLKCVNYFPVYVRELKDKFAGLGFDNITLRKFQKESRKLGAQLVPLGAGRSAVLYHQAKKHFVAEYGCDGYFMPNALKLGNTVRATAKELLTTTHVNLYGGSWVISISSGTIAAGVIAGLQRAHDAIDIYAHMGYSRSFDSAARYICSNAGYWPDNFWLIDEGYEYKDKVDYDCPFPCNEYYDLKAWKWLNENIDTLRDPIIFWNIGA